MYIFHVKKDSLCSDSSVHVADKMRFDFKCILTHTSVSYKLDVFVFTKENTSSGNSTL